MQVFRLLLAMATGYRKPEMTDCVSVPVTVFVKDSSYAVSECGEVRIGRRN